MNEKQKLTENTKLTEKLVDPYRATFRALKEKQKDYDDGCAPGFTLCCGCIFFLVAIVYSLWVGFTWHSVSTISTTRFNQALFDYSPTWSASINLIPSDLKSKSFLMSQMPDVVRWPTRITENYVLTPSAKNYSYVSYNLLCGSEISLAYRAESSFPLGFYILDNYQFERWQRLFFYNGPLNGRYIIREQFTNSPYGNVSFVVDNCYEGYENTYFLWETETDSTGSIAVNFSLGVNVYDTVAHRLQECEGECNYKLDYGSEQVVLVNLASFMSNSSEVAHVTVTTDSRFSTWLSLGLGLSVPFGLIAIGFAIPYLYLRIRFCCTKSKLAKHLVDRYMATIRDTDGTETITTPV